MKKLLCLTLVLSLLLTGCAINGEPEPTTETSVPETTPPSLYVAESAVEEQTNGAVKRFDLPEQYDSLTSIGEKLLLVKQGDAIYITELNGEKCVVGKTIDLPSTVTWQAMHSGITYYDAAKRQVVFLDPQLQERSVLDLPEQMQGTPVISADGSNIFYCTETEICALDTERKISRPIKSHTCKSQNVLGQYFDAQMIACRIEDMDGVVSTLYLSSENGQTIAADNNITSLYTCEDLYFALRQDGVTEQAVVGNRNETPKLLQVEGDLYSALELGGVIGVNATENGISLNWFDVTSGLRTAAVALEGFEDVRSVLADRWNSCVWLLATDAQNQMQVLLRWTPDGSAAEDETVYTGTLYTEESPDEEGLEACADRVSDMNKAYGVTIRIWDKALKETNGYVFVPEHQVGAIEKTLDDLEEVLGMFPSKFLSKSSIKNIRFCIVRSVNGAVTSTFYWDNSDPTIVLCAGTDVYSGVLKGIGYVIDSKILSEDDTYYDWNSLNPEAFVYGEPDTYSKDYLNPESAYFLSEESMTSAREERCQVFYQAILADNAAAFQSDVMQQKLLLLCRGIRDAWSLNKKTDVYPWEQYLAESIAYQG